MTAISTLTIAKLKEWAEDNRRLAETVLLATAFAQTERERVDAYIRPIFDSYGFTDEDGAPIPCPDRLYNCPDDARVADYYAACTVAHRENGWTGDPECCPALVAEDLQRQAEQALILASASIGIGDGVNRSLDLRTRAVNHLIGVCFADGKGRTADQIIRGEP